MKTSSARLILFTTLLWVRSTQAVVYQETNGIVTIEAEHFDSRTVNADNHHWHVSPTDDGVDFLLDTADAFANARGNSYTQLLPNGAASHTATGNALSDPFASYRVFIRTPGTYQLYLRWASQSGSDDSLYGSVVEFKDGLGGTINDWYRYASGSGTPGDFSRQPWRGTGGPERVDASGGEIPAAWNITEPGLYTIQLTYREDGCAVDALVFQLTSLPAPSSAAPNFGPPESPISTDYPPFISARTPGRGQVGVFPETSLQVQITDGASTQVNTNSITLSFNGVPLGAAVSKAGNITTITATPPALLPAGSVNPVTVIFSDNAAPAKSFTNTWSFTVENYATLTPDLARPAGTVDTTSSGFNGLITQAPSQGDTFTLPNTTKRAEDQLRGLLIDPSTGQPYPNLAGVTNFTVTNAINWDRNGTDINATPPQPDNFNSLNGYPNELIPGIPGNEGGLPIYNNIAAELIAYLDLSAGLHRFGVNSDDGFRVTSGVNPRDAAALQLGVFEGGRGAADTLFSVFVQANGIYPVRLIWYQGNGGANLEFFSANIQTGQKILINDGSNAGAVKAYRVSTFPLPPLVNRIRPLPGAVNVDPGSAVFVELLDQTSPVNSTSVAMTFNGSAVVPQVAKLGSRTTISFDPPGLLPTGSTNAVALMYSDNVGTSYTNAWQFVVQNYATLPTIPLDRKLSSVDTTKPGFLLKLRMLPLGVTRPGGNTVATAILQLNDAFIDPATGQPYADQINRSAVGNEPGEVFNADGTFPELSTINYNEAAGGTDQGVFRSSVWPDEQTPGVPGLDGGLDYYAMLASAILDLKAGIYHMGVNSDDGFVVTYDDPRDVFSTQLGSAPDRGQATTLFDFVVLEDGSYPFQLIWWESGGSSECEWFIVDATTGEQVLINDLAHFFEASPVKAYRPASIAPARPYVRSVKPQPGETVVANNTTVDVSIVDGAAKVVTNSIQLLLNGTALTPAITQASGVTTISATPPTALPYLSSNLVTLMFTDNGTPALRRTNSWSFVVESSLPKAVLVIASPAAPTASELAIQNRLQSVFGFDATFADDDAAVPAFANRAALILVSSSVGSGNITKYRDLATPILDWEWAAYDGLALSSADGQSIDNSQTQINIVNAAHPLAAGFPTGMLTVFPAPAAQFASVDPTLLAPSVTVVANAVDGTGRAVLFGAEAGAVLQPDPVTGNPVIAPARRTGIFLGGDTFIALNADGLKLFDAAVRWTANIALRPQFNAPTRSGGNVIISWTGVGVLQVATNLTGSPTDWSDVPGNPASPYPATSEAPRKFFRLRQ